MSVARLLDALPSLEVAVIGDAMLDVYVEGTSHRLSQEAPVPVVDAAGETRHAGGAANTAVNVRRLGARTSLIALAGDDADGDALRALLRDAGVGDAVVCVGGRMTMSKTRVVADGHIVVRVDRGDATPAAGPDERALAAAVDDALERCDAVIVSDYGYGAVTGAVVERLRARSAGARPVVVVDSKDLARFRAARPDAVKPNFGQAAALLGLAPAPGARRADDVAAHAERLLDATGARLAAVTLDADGALLCERGRPPYRTYTRPRSDAHASGAGDTFVAALALALAAGADAAEAGEVATAAADVVVGAPRVGTCSALELREHEMLADKYVDDAERLAARVELHRRDGRRVVLTNGCFDILHRGHVSYLNRARRLGDVLVVGVNSDAGVRRLKGDGRPVNALEDRVQVLAALSSVDHVVAFDEDTPERLVEIVRPDVFVKGGDYTIDMLPEAAAVERHGGVVEILPYERDRSTTSLIERIRARSPSDAPAR
ncbi:MAG TPA: D-glycero-beta-D-manno-heptose 1-phosphate adenylyltransferase [Actinomycetota bacterium]|nr:D-glycero-beta-D-manno-heptose 1-phosphate adenylyltransferase [Actinomycetota bacterium]